MKESSIKCPTCLIPIIFDGSMKHFNDIGIYKCPNCGWYPDKLLHCSTCGAECPIERADIKMKTQSLTWRQLHSNPPHKLEIEE